MHPIHFHIQGGLIPIWWCPNWCSFMLFPAYSSMLQFWTATNQDWVPWSLQCPALLRGPLCVGTGAYRQYLHVSQCYAAAVALLPCLLQQELLSVAEWPHCFVGVGGERSMRWHWNCWSMWSKPARLCNCPDLRTKGCSLAVREVSRQKWSCWFISWKSAVRKHSSGKSLSSWRPEGGESEVIWSFCYCGEKHSES